MYSRRYNKYLDPSQAFEDDGSLMVFWQALAPNPIEGMLYILHIISKYSFSMLLDSIVYIHSLFPVTSTVIGEFEINTICQGSQLIRGEYVKIHQKFSIGLRKMVPISVFLVI